MAGRCVLLAFFVLLASVQKTEAQPSDVLKATLRDPTWALLIEAYTNFSSQNQASYTAVVKSATLFSIAAYDTLACFSEDLDGLVVGATLRRPANEHTLYRKRKALAYATYRVLESVYGRRAAVIFDPVMKTLGFRTSDKSELQTTSVGIGNLVAKAVLNSAYNDEAQLDRKAQTGDLPPYVPRNTPYSLVYKTRWQPLIVQVRDELYAQHYYAEEYTKKTPVAGKHPSTYPCRPPTEVYYPTRPEYRAEATKVVLQSAKLNDTGKMLAEGVDGGFSDNGNTFLINKYNWDLDHQVIWNFINTMCTRESLIVSAFYKAYYDTIRPISMIRYTGLFETIEAWAGPGQGIKSIPATQFRQYNSRTDPSPEYPSGAVTAVGTFATVASNFLGTDEFGWKVTFQPGSSQIEQGTPAKPVTFTFPTFSSYKARTKEGRLTGLVHFDFAVEEGNKLGEAIAAALYLKLSDLFKTDILVAR